MEGGCLVRQACNRKESWTLSISFNMGSALVHEIRCWPTLLSTPLNQSNPLCLVLWISRQDQSGLRRLHVNDFCSGGTHAWLENIKPALSKAQNQTTHSSAQFWRRVAQVITEDTGPAEEFRWAVWLKPNACLSSVLRKTRVLSRLAVFARPAWGYPCQLYLECQMGGQDG